MSKAWRIILVTCGILLLLGVALAGVGALTGGSVSRIVATTDIADMTKFFSREQLDMLLSFFF